MRTRAALSGGKYGPLTPRDRQTGVVNRVHARRSPRSLIFGRGIEDIRVRRNDERQTGRQRASGGIPECWHLYGQFGGSRYGGGFRVGPWDGAATREGRLCSASCIIHLHRSGLASAAPDPRPCPLYLLQWLVERYIRPLTVTTSWRPSFRFLGFPSRTAVLITREMENEIESAREKERETPSHSLFSFSLRDTTCRPHTFIPFPVTSLFYSLFLRSILRVRKSFVWEREGNERRRRDTYPVEQCHITSDNSALALNHL